MLSVGSSALAVPDPTKMACEVALHLWWTSRREASLEIHWEVLSAAAILASKLEAILSTTHGLPVAMLQVGLERDEGLFFANADFDGDAGLF